MRYRRSTISVYQCVRVLLPGYRLGKVVLLLLIPITVLAAGPASVQTLQIAYIYKIASMVSWPESSADDTFSICVLESGHRFGDALGDSLAERTIGGVPTLVHSVTWQSLLDQDMPQRCDLVYVMQPPDDAQEAELERQRNQVSDVLWILSPDVNASNIGLFELVYESNRIIIYLNKDLLAASRLSVAAPLLAVAKPR